MDLGYQRVEAECLFDWVVGMMGGLKREGWRLFADQRVLSNLRDPEWSWCW